MSSPLNTRQKDSLNNTPAIHFIADDKGSFAGALGMLFDASERLGGPRSKVSFSPLCSIRCVFSRGTLNSASCSSPREIRLLTLPWNPSHRS